MKVENLLWWSIVLIVVLGAIVLPELLEEIPYGAR